MNAKEQATSSNFSFLGTRYPELERIGARSERYFSEDPIISLMTVRRFGEVLAQLVAAGSGLFTDAWEPQADFAATAACRWQLRQHDHASCE
jgi:type I restriction enzyme, R subunit